MRSVLELHVNLFGDVFELHVNLFGVCLNPTYTHSEWSRPAKLAQGVALLQVGGDEVSAEGETQNEVSAEGETQSASAMRHSLREAGALQAA